MSGRLIVLVLGSFGLIIAALLAAGVMPLEVFSEWIRGSLGSPRAISGTLRETTPLLIAGIGVFVALRAGLFNIGIEGQFLVGALCAASLGLAIPGWIGVIAGICVGSIAGAIWAFPAGWIKAFRGGHEVISTIMLNNIALALTSALVSGPLRDKSQQSATTSRVGTMIPMIGQLPSLSVSVALILGIGLVALFALWLKRTVAGYELDAVGANPTAAKFAGIEVTRTTVLAMVVSGGIGGLAGSLQVFAFEGRFYQGFSPGYGFDALGVALLAGAYAWAVLPAALLFGILAKGATSVQLLGIPKGISGILLGLLIIGFAAFRYSRKKR